MGGKQKWTEKKHGDWAVREGPDPERSSDAIKKKILEKMKKDHEKRRNGMR